MARPKFWEETPMRGVYDNVLSGEISVAALQKMMLHKRNVKHLKRLYSYPLRRYYNIYK